MALWDTIKGWVAQNAQQLVAVELADANAPLIEIKPHQHYFRIWLTEMFLRQSRQWFTNVFPAVNSQVRLRFADQPAVTFSHVTSTKQDQIGTGVYLDYPVTELIPYSGGVVEVQAGLVALTGSNSLLSAISLLKGFSGLIAAPLGQALSIAEQVTSGMDQLFRDAQGKVHLGFHQAFAAAGGGGVNVLRPIYVAVVSAPANQFSASSLSIREGRLAQQPQAGGAAGLLAGHDYMVFRIEGREERDDWRLKNIAEPLNRAIEAIGQGDLENAKKYKAATLAAAFLSADLTVTDRRRVVESIKEELAAIEGGGLHAIPGVERGLNEIVSARAPRIDQARAKGPLKFEEVFGA